MRGDQPNTWTQGNDQIEACVTISYVSMQLLQSTKNVILKLVL